MTKNEKRLNKFLKQLTKLSRETGLYISWSQMEGITINDVNLDCGDANPENFGYSCITEDKEFESSIIAKALYYDD